MTDALENHEDTVSIGSRTITNLRFADDIDGLAGEEDELANLVERLHKASKAYGMEISAEKTKLMTNCTSVKRFCFFIFYQSSLEACEGLAVLNTQ